MLLRANRHLAIDLPMKVLVQEDDVGLVRIGWTPVETLKARHKIEGRDDVLMRVAGAIEAFTVAAGN